MYGKEIWVMIKHLKKTGMKNTDIAQKLNIDRKTVANHLAKDTAPRYKRKVKVIKKIEPFKDYVKKRLEKYNLTSQRIYEEIKKMDYKGKYGMVNYLVKEIKKEFKNNAYVRFETLPGEQAQVDWGYMGKIYDYELQKEIKVYCFLMILGYSRTLYVEFFTDMKFNNFLRGHNNSFKYFSGYTKEILYDNLKSVVIKRKLFQKDSKFNKKFMDFAGYYGFMPILCRPYKPNTKGKIEKSVDYVKRNFYIGNDFKSLREINEAKNAWLNKINNRIHQTTKQIPFQRLEKERLLSIANKSLYDVSETYYRKVFSDIHFSFEGNRYSTPHRYVGREVLVKKAQDNKSIKIYYRNELIAIHKLNQEEKDIYVTDKSHMEALKKTRMNFVSSKPRLKEKAEIKSDKAVHIINNNMNDMNVEIRDLHVYEGVCQ
jgi:transposase